MSPDVRPNHQPRSENKWFFVDRPKRNSGTPQAEWEKDWLNLVRRDWARLTRTAYESLTIQKDAVLKPELLTPASKDDKFRFRRSAIALQIIPIGTTGDVKNVFNNFIIGTEQEPDFKGKAHEEKVYEITRGELFQIFVAVVARLEIPHRTKQQRRKLRQMKKIRNKLPSSSNLLGAYPRVDKPVSQVADSSPIVEFTPTAKSKTVIEYRKRPPIIDPFTSREVDRLMKEKPYRGGPMMNVR